MPYKYLEDVGTADIAFEASECNGWETVIF
jgi:hypothetical protein